MIKKERKKPLKLRKLEALHGRLPENYPKKHYVENELGKVMAGWRGEQAIDFHLSFLPKEDYLILHDLRLEDSENRFFQIDTLLLSQNFHLILEVKNMAGTLYFNDVPQQLVQYLNNEEKAYACPILQAERQQLQLEAFLKKLHLPVVPILFFVVISHSHSVIKLAPSFHKAKRFVIHASALPEKISSIQLNSSTENATSKELKKIARLLIKHHQPSNPDYLERFKIPQSEILTGVHCPNCRQLAMKRNHGKWVCPYCQNSLKDAHIAALHEYSLLFGPKINNQQLRDFLHLPSVSVATKMLTSLGLRKQGEFRGCRYLLDDE
jgi:ssDNA-binding Zn-finger/Zn-ribbon topoisomerase 1